MVSESEASKRNGVILTSLVAGVIQSDLCHRIGASSRDVSRLARSLEKHGLIIRKKVFWQGRHSYFLKLSSESSERELVDYLSTKRWGRHSPLRIGSPRLCSLENSDYLKMASTLSSMSLLLNTRLPSATGRSRVRSARETTVMVRGHEK